MHCCISFTFFYFFVCFEWYLAVIICITVMVKVVAFAGWNDLITDICNCTTFCIQNCFIQIYCNSSNTFITHMSGKHKSEYLHEKYINVRQRHKGVLRKTSLKILNFITEPRSSYMTRLCCPKQVTYHLNLSY